MLSRVELHASVAWRFAARGEGEVCAVFQRSFYIRIQDRFACVGEASLGCGPLNALVEDFRQPAIGERISVAVSALWEPPPFARNLLDLNALKKAKVPEEGLG